MLAEVESSEEGDYTGGHYMLALADCHRRIELEFCLTTSLTRRQSLAKIGLFMEVLSEFRAALAAEAELIAEREQEKKNEAAKKRKAKGAEP